MAVELIAYTGTAIMTGLWILAGAGMTFGMFFSGGR